MRRRTLLGALAGATAATAGCAQLSETVDKATEGAQIENLGVDHPWDGEPIVLAVAYDDGVDRRENFAELIEASAAFWEEHAEQYAGYEVEYDLDPDADDPDVRVTLVDEVSNCHRNDDGYMVVGCAPLITDQAPDTASVQIKSGYSDNLTQTTITHELGHTLGLGHDDEPTEVMSSDPADRIPNYETRRAIHEAFLAGMRSFNEGSERWAAANDAMDEERWTTASEAFASAADEYDAAVSSFGAAASEADDIDADGAVDICADAEAKAAGFRAAAEAWNEATVARAGGDYDRFEERSQAAREHRADADSHAIRESDALAVELGLQ